MGKDYIEARRQLTAKISLCGEPDAWVEQVDYDEQDSVAKVIVTMGHGIGVAVSRLSRYDAFPFLSPKPAVTFELVMSGDHVHHIRPRNAAGLSAPLRDAARCMLPILQRLTLEELRAMEHPVIVRGRGGIRG
ncbi:MAG: hypothetical protein KC503_28555 [Myxococcales bacterium]|nr:hypothetical protein [Myxococcales bacterium]